MTATDYLALAKHDYDTLVLLSQAAAQKQPRFDASDWKVALTFYMACIYVKALAAIRGKQFRKHEDLRTWINVTQDVIPIASTYRALEEKSRDARYEGRKFRRAELEEVSALFNRVRDGIERLLASAGITPLPGLDPSAVLPIGQDS